MAATVAALNAEAQDGALPDFVLFADPRSLDLIREALSEATRKACLGEVALDLSQATVYDIERYVTAL